MTIQEQFVKQHRRNHNLISIYRILLFLLFIGIWEYCASSGSIDPFFFSSPSRLIKTCISLFIEKDLIFHISTTLIETLISFIIVIIVSLIVASLLWYFPKSASILEPYLVVLNSLPKSALAPLFLVWLGSGYKTIITAGVSVAVFGAIISLYTGFKQTDAEKMKLILTLGGNKKDIFLKVVLPGNLSLLLSTMKVNIGLSLVGVIIGEFFAARKGLGYLIIYGSQVFQMGMVITSIFILCIIAFCLYLIIQFMEHMTAKKSS